KREPGERLEGRGRALTLRTRSGCMRPPPSFETRAAPAPQDEGGPRFARVFDNADASRYRPAKPLGANLRSSLPGLTRQSINLRKTFLQARWMRGSSPRMTGETS